MSRYQKIIALHLICTNTNCFYKIIIAKLLALNVLSIALYTFKNFNIYITYILQNYLSGHALKIKVYTQIIFEQETDSNIIWTLTIHKQTSLNFDDKKHIILLRTLKCKRTKKDKDTSHPPSWIFKIHDVPTWWSSFLKEAIILANMLNVKIHLDLYVYTFYVNCEILKNIHWDLTNWQNVL